METSLRRFAVLGGLATMEESKEAFESNGEEERYGEEIDLQVGAEKTYEDEIKSRPPNLNSINKKHTTKLEKSSSDYESGSSSSAKKEQVDEQLESTKAEIDEVMEENQRLRTYLDRIMKDYRTLQTQYQDHVLHQQSKTVPNHHNHIEEPEFVALSLGRTSSGTIKDETFKTPIGQDDDKECLKLGLYNCKVEVPKTTQVELSPDLTPENSIEETKEDVKETSPTNKGVKNDRDGGDDDISLHNPAKRARVSVRVRCDTPSMNDGCQWRKYGQKIAKGNPCPRAYYRCTVAPSCPVRKQVQRCAQDMSILITTYEGTHNHPLPISATAMASTTSAAAAMLLSGSSTSESGSSSSAATTTNMNGLNFYISDNSRPKSIYLSNSSISSNPSFPTITLDLTSHSSSSSSHLSRLSSYPPRYPTTNLNFSSLESNSLPISWSNGILTNYASQQSFNKNQTSTNSFTIGAPQESIYQSYLQKNNQQQTFAPDTIAAATKAITTDPSFQSALAAALSSLIGSAANGTSTAGNESNQTIKPNEPFPILSSFPLNANNANKCAPSFGNKSSSSTSTQPGSLMFLSPSFPFSNSKSKSNSPGGDSRDHVL